MGIFKNVFDACHLAGRIGTPYFAEAIETELCQSSIAVFFAALESGQPVEVDRGLAEFEHSETEAYLETLTMEQAKPWYAVLFHRNLVNTVAFESEERKAKWSALAGILEAADVPPTQAGGISG